MQNAQQSQNHNPNPKVRNNNASGAAHAAGTREAKVASQTSQTANKQRLRKIFEESFKQFGPFERNEGIGKPYKDDAQSALYISFSNALNRIQQGNIEPKAPAVNEEGQFIVMREDAKKGFIAPNGLKPQPHYAKACADAIKHTNTTGAKVVVFSAVRTYEPKKEPAKPAVLAVLNPMTVINQMFAYHSQVPDADRPDNTPLIILNNGVGSEVHLKSGEKKKFTTPGEAIVYVDGFLKGQKSEKAQPKAPVAEQLQAKPVVQETAAEQIACETALL